MFERALLISNPEAKMKLFHWNHCNSVDHSVCGSNFVAALRGGSSNLWRISAALTQTLLRPLSFFVLWSEKGMVCIRHAVDADASVTPADGTSHLQPLMWGRFMGAADPVRSWKHSPLAHILCVFWDHRESDDPAVFRLLALWFHFSVTNQNIQMLTHWHF